MPGIHPYHFEMSISSTYTFHGCADDTLADHLSVVDKLTTSIQLPLESNQQHPPCTEVSIVSADLHISSYLSSNPSIMSYSSLINVLRILTRLPTFQSNLPCCIIMFLQGAAQTEENIRTLTRYFFRLPHLFLMVVQLAVELAELTIDESPIFPARSEDLDRGI